MPHATRNVMHAFLYGSTPMMPCATGVKLTSLHERGLVGSALVQRRLLR
jgi:hypothetical protein